MANITRLNEELITNLTVQLDALLQVVAFSEVGSYRDELIKLAAYVSADLAVYALEQQQGVDYA